MKQKRNFRNRGHKVKTVNIDYSHEEIIKIKKVNLSLLVRQLLNEYFKTNYGPLFQEIINQGEENE